MKPIKVLNKINLRKITNELTAAMQKVADKYDLGLDYKGASYVPNFANLKFQIQTKGENGEILNQAAEDFLCMCKVYGLLRSDLNQQFVGAGGEMYRITGCSPRRSKYPILGERIRDKKRFKFTPEMVIAGLSRNLKPSKGILR